MDPLRAEPLAVPGFDDVNLENRKGKNWFRDIRQAINYIYMKPGDDGKYHLNKKIAFFTLSTATTACATFGSLYKGVSLYTQYSNDPDSVSQEEVQAIAWVSAFSIGGLLFSGYKVISEMKVALKEKFQEQKEILEAAMILMESTKNMVDVFNLVDRKMKRYIEQQERRSIPEGSDERCETGRAAPLFLDLSSEDTKGERHEDRKKYN